MEIHRILHKARQMGEDSMKDTELFKKHEYTDDVMCEEGFIMALDERDKYRVCGNCKESIHGDNKVMVNCSNNGEAKRKTDSCQDWEEK